MDAKELHERIESHKADLPMVREVTPLYAEMIAAISSKLTPDEIDGLIALGALIHDRADTLVPVLHWEDVAERLKSGKPIS